MRVTVIDNMREQLSDYLDHYYRGVQLQADEPGTRGRLPVKPPEASGFLQPESWDYARIGASRAGSCGRAENPAVRGTRERQRTRAHANGSSRSESRELAAWFADRQGTRYFAGARVAIGRIGRIGACSATIIRDDGSLYELIARTADEGKSC